MRVLPTIICVLFGLVQSYGQVAIGTLEPTAALDINYVTSMPSLSDPENLQPYNSIVVSDVDGNLGLRTRFDTQLEFLNNYLVRMERYLEAKDISTVDLEMPITIEIEPGQTRVFEIFYSVPMFIAYYNYSDINGSGTISLVRSINGQADQNLEKADRKLSFSGVYNGPASAKGGPVSNFYFDTVENTSDQTMVVVYNLFASSSTTNFTIRIGMYANEKAAFSNNYNWGRGMIMINEYDVIVD